MNEVMKITSEFQSQHGVDVQLADWNKLAGLPRVRTVHEVRELFYPSLEPDVEPCSSGTRRRDLFLGVDDGAYVGLYRTVLSEPGRRFIDIQALLKTTKQEGKLMSIVMSHVALWVNAEPEKVADRDNNKPALRKDLVPALRAKYGDMANNESRGLQQAVLKYVHENAKDFTSTVLEHYLHEYPSGDDEAYGTRFKHEVWREVLSIVTIYAGPTLQHKYIGSAGSVETRNINPPTIARTARDLICQIPDVANNLALRSPAAAEQLLMMMQPVIARWISEQRTDVPDHRSEGGRSSTVQDTQCAESEHYLRASRGHASLQWQTSEPATKRARYPWHSERSGTHGSVEEAVVSQSPKSGPTIASDAGTPPRTEVQDREVIDFSLAGLNNLRRQHRHKSASSQRRAPAQRAPLEADSYQPRDPPLSVSSRATTGAGHWRQLASARRGK